MQICECAGEPLPFRCVCGGWRGHPESNGQKASTILYAVWYGYGTGNNI